MVFVLTATVYSEQCTSALLFQYFKISQGTSKMSLKNYMASFVTPFFFTCTHPCKSLSNELSLNIAKFEIWLVCMHGDGESVIH